MTTDTCACQLCTGAGRSSYRPRAVKQLMLASATADDWLHAEIGELDD